MDEATAAFDARGAALYLDSSASSSPVYSRGDMEHTPQVEVLLRHDGHDFGRLALAGRRGDVAYSESDRLALESSAASVAAALALARATR